MAATLDSLHSRAYYFKYLSIIIHDCGVLFINGGTHGYGLMGGGKRVAS